MAGLLTAAQGAHTLLVGKGEPSIDNWTFKLFYKYTSSLLLASSFLVTANQFFGDPIQCDLPGEGVSSATLKSYCWMYASFNIPPDFQGSCARHSRLDKFGDEVFNSFYQWVSLSLVGQALLFYLPRALWLSLEGGLMKHLAKDVTGKVVENASEKCEELINTFNKHLHNKYDRYFNCFIACEVLNVAILVSQVFMTDRFLGHTFLTYGLDVVLYYRAPPEENLLAQRYNPMCEAFPRVASCTYYTYGAGGGQVGLNALCILALNIIIDKVYLLLWWWYGMLLLCGIIRLGERVLQFSCSCFRYHLMKFRMHRYFKDTKETESLNRFLTECSYGDWFVLYQMSKNMNRNVFFMFLTAISKIPKGQLRQLLPQIQVVNAFKGSVKKKTSVAPCEKTGNKWTLNLAKTVEPPKDETNVEAKVQDTEHRKKTDEYDQEECIRRKKHDEDDSDNDINILRHTKRKDDMTKDKTVETSQSWKIARSQFGKQIKSK